MIALIIGGTMPLALPAAIVIGLVFFLIMGYQESQKESLQKTDILELIPSNEC